MHNKTKLFVVCMIAAVALLAAAGGWAAMVCTTVGEGADEATIAVAANFTEPLKDLIAACQSTGNPCSDTKYTVCADATANLKAAIDSNYSAYGYFFAADTTAKVYNTHSGAGTAYEYAKGIPVFFGSHNTSTMPDVSKLITHDPALSGYATDITTSSLSGYTINTADSKYIAVAGTAAPYGKMSHTIINAMMSTSLPGTIPTDYVHSPLYDNIGLTFNSVTDGTNKSGWVSKAQICSGLSGSPPNYVYVGFTHADYTLHQWAIQLNTGTGYEAATALHDYINTTLACPSGTGWTNFLSTHCYGAP